MVFAPGDLQNLPKTIQMEAIHFPGMVLVDCPVFTGEKPGSEPEEAKLQNASKQIVQNAILRAVQQVSQESQQKEERTTTSRSRLQLGMGKLTKKHEKK
ncbi:A-kinase anchor protein inhibitor 1 [Phascolarctos cinereus]